jgi:DNA-directed RNA polymerase subunit K/omega
MLPIYEMINYPKNRYLICKAIMKRARQVNFVGDEKLEEYNGKIVSLTMRQVLDSEIKYLNPLEESDEE